MSGTLCYEGVHIAVRPVRKGDGSTRWALYRPGMRSAVLDELDDLGTANRVAGYIDAHGGSYDAAARRAAKLDSQQ